MMKKKIRDINVQEELDKIGACYKFRELNLTFADQKEFYGSIRSELDVAEFFRKEIKDTIEIQEHFLVLFLNKANTIIGYYHHSIGSSRSTTVDIQLIVAMTLKVIAESVIVCHNHPSGRLLPSDNDITVTKELQQVLKSVGVTLIDHLIISKYGSYSFLHANQLGLLEGNSGLNENLQSELRRNILTELKKVTVANSPNIHSLLKSKNGYQTLESNIITRLLHTGLSPSAIIPQFEQELSMNA